jgi:sensor histidine kinase YesM
MIRGFEKKKDFRHIQVKGYMKARKLCFEIQDDGAGMTADVIDFLNSDPTGEEENELKWPGIRSLKRRLRYFFSDDFDLTFSRIPGDEGGVRVLLSFSSGL